MDNKIKIGIIFIIVIVGIGALYFYADGKITNAINEVYRSIEYLDYSVEITSLIPISVKYTYVYRLTNPTNIDVILAYYADVFIGDEYIQTLEFDILVPANEFVTTSFISTVGTEAAEILMQLSNPTYHYYGQMEGSGTYLFFTISKSWTDEWDWTQP